MNNINKVTSLELSKKIHDKAKEKGFELPESEYFHLVVEDKYNTASEIVNFSRENRSGKYNDGTKWSEKFYKAYDIAELGEMLPSEIAVKELICKINIEKTNHWTVRYGIYAFGQLLKTIHCEGADTEAESRGKMFFYLLDNDLYE